MKKLLILILLLFITAPALASDKIYLFRDYYYGMSRSQVARSGAVPCAEIGAPADVTAGMLCSKERINLADHEWQGIFRFVNDKLDDVILTRSLNQNAVMALFPHFMDAGYVPVYIKSGDKSLDILSQMGDPESEASKRILHEFQSYLPKSPEITSYLVKWEILKNLRPIKNMLEFLEKMPKDAVVATISCSRPHQGAKIVFQAFGQARGAIEP